jgi:transglutaminase-like putative cysteine protease
MNLLVETGDPAAYLDASGTIDFHHPAVHALLEKLRAQGSSEEERARLAFLFARDEILHSFDLPGPRAVTISASETLMAREGICFAKSHLFAALLRGLGIPAGFSYQRVMRKGTPESGYALHGLNAIYLSSRQQWLRFDPRGNKPGVRSEFSLDEERLAYPIRPELGEIDYPHVLVEPDPKVLAAMRASGDSAELFERRPSELAARPPRP